MDWQTEEGSTIGRLLTYLTKMDRYDIIDDLGFMNMISMLYIFSTDWVGYTPVSGSIQNLALS